jgi:hypothetical protein
MSGVASNLHPDFSTTPPNYLPWGGVRAGAAFFRDEVQPNLPDVLDFGRGFRASAVACRAEINGKRIRAAIHAASTQLAG